MLTVADVMTRDVQAVAPETSLRDLVEVLADRHLSGVPVVSGERVIGVVSAADVMAFIATLPQHDAETEDDEGGSGFDATENDSGDSYFGGVFDGAVDDVDDMMRRGSPLTGIDPVAAHVVADVMTSPARSIAASASVRDAADAMRLAGIHRMVVLDGTRLAGIVTTSDVSRAVADRRLRSPDTYVEVDLRSWP